MVGSSEESVIWKMQLWKDLKNGSQKWNHTSFAKPTNTLIPYVIFARKKTTSSSCKYFACIISVLIVNSFLTISFSVTSRYIATELCSGTLKDLVKGRYKGPSVGSRADVLRQILKGMAHLHLLKIVHGNLKPTNILISIPSGAVGPMMKLTDFGLLHNYKSYPSLDNNNREFSAAFTESWRAPESRLTIASDMFSYGHYLSFLS